MGTLKISVVIPVYNERDTIFEIVNLVLKNSYTNELIIVDDCSVDGTYEILMKIPTDDRMKIYRHSENKGKGGAVSTGIKHVTGDVIIIQDADLEYNPKEYELLLNPIINNGADVVYGSRFLSGSRRVLNFWHTMGNTLITLFSNMFTNLALTDVETGYKVFRKKVIEGYEFQEKGFGFENEFTALIKKCEIYEVRISYKARWYDKGKKIRARDALIAMYCTIKYNFWKKI